MPKLIGDVALEARGIRLPPKVWKRIDHLSKGKPGPWIRQQIEAILSLVPDMPNQHDTVTDRADENVEFE